MRANERPPTDDASTLLSRSVRTSQDDGIVSTVCPRDGVVLRRGDRDGGGVAEGERPAEGFVLTDGGGERVPPESLVRACALMEQPEVTKAVASIASAVAHGAAVGASAGAGRGDGGERRERTRGAGDNLMESIVDVLLEPKRLRAVSDFVGETSKSLMSAFAAWPRITRRCCGDYGRRWRERGRRARETERGAARGDVSRGAKIEIYSSTSDANSWIRRCRRTFERWARITCRGHVRGGATTSKSTNLLGHHAGDGGDERAFVRARVDGGGVASGERHPSSVLRHEDKNSDSPASPLVSRFTSVETSTPPASSGPPRTEKKTFTLRRS